MSTPTTPIVPGTPAKPPHGSLEVFGSAVVAGLVAIGGLILTVYTQKPGVVVPWALCVLGLSAFAPIVPQVPRLAQICIVVVIAVALVSSSIVTFADPKLLTHTTVRVVPEHGRTALTVTTNIKLAPIAEPISFCNEFVGTGTIPAGYELWIFDRDAEDPTAKYYLDSQAIQAGNNWSADNIQIGNGTGDTGHRTSIFAVLLPAPFMNWLLQTVNINNGTPSSDLPPEAHIADQAVVTRSSDAKPCPQ
jgi:hypothetical protein